MLIRHDLKFCEVKPCHYCGGKGYLTVAEKMNAIRINEGVTPSKEPKMKCTFELKDNIIHITLPYEAVYHIHRKEKETTPSPPTPKIGQYWQRQDTGVKYIIVGFANMKTKICLRQINRENCYLTFADKFTESFIYISDKPQ